MRLLILFFFIVIYFTADLLFAQAPTTGATNFSVSNNDGNRLRVNWTRGNGSQVIVIASESPTFNDEGTPVDGTDYTENAQFGIGNQVGTNNFVVYKGVATNVTVTGLVQNTTYYFRIIEFNGTGAGTLYTTLLLSGSGNTVSKPTNGSTAMVATPAGNSTSLTWTRGNGSRVLIILQEGSAPDNPVDYTNYSASSNFGSGSALGSGRVVYFNTNNTVNITSLQPNTTYFYKVVESNGSVAPVYDLTSSLTGSFTTEGTPSVAATNFTVSNLDGSRFRANWTRGNGGKILVVASLSATFNGAGVPADGTDYDADATFGSGNSIGAGNFVVYEGTGTNVTINGLVFGTTYFLRMYEFNGTTFSTQYNTTGVLSGSGTTLSPPTIGSTDLVATTTGNTASLTWTRGNGMRSLVILQSGSSPDNPVNYTNYSANASFGSGSTVGTNGRVVYFNTSNTVNIINLQPNTQYFYKVVEANGPSTPVFDVSNALVGSFTTSGAPTVGSTNFTTSSFQGDRFTISLTRGNGTNRLVVARQDEAVLWTPVDGIDYNANAAFGLGDNLGNNTFVVGDMTSSSLTITGLTPATTYHISVFEYNGAATNTVYQTLSTLVLTGQGSTLSPPGTSASGLLFTNISGHNATIAFTAGNGTSRLVLARAGSPVTDMPVNLVNYSASANFGVAQSLGTSKILYEGTGTGFTVQALQPNTTYHFAVFEYNGSTAPVYKQVDPGIGSFTTLGLPTVAPTNLTFSGMQGDRMSLSYTTGNGFGRIVIAKEGAPVDVFPTDFTTYTANPNFGNAAAHLGNGNYVIENDAQVTGNSSTFIGNLAIGQTYHFAIIETNGTGTERIYMNSADALTGSQSTLSAPTLQATNISFSNITANTMTVNWENGNGNARIVLIREGQAVQDMPANLINYNANFNYTSAPSLGSAKIVYDGTGTSVSVSSIPPGEYHVAVIEYNGGSQPVYRTSDPLTGIVNVGAKPIVPASNLSFSNINGNSISLSCTRGDGLSRMLIVKANSAVDAWPIDFTGYTASSNFGSGSDLGGGNFVVAATTSAVFNIGNLQPSTTYHFAIVEYNGSGASAFYQLSATAATASSTTLSGPVVTTSNFFANNIIGNSMQVTWTNGSGTGRLIVAKAGSAVDFVPNNLTDYNTNNFLGADLGSGNYGVYDGAGDNFILNNLQPGTTYHFAAFEYNGFSNGKVYLTSVVGRTSFTTAPRPSVAPKNLNVGSVNGDRFTLSFSVGNGTRRLIVLRKGGLVDAVPTDLTTYTPAAFGLGSEIGSGNFVTTLTTGSSLNITGLEPNESYGVAVFELDGAAGNERYLITSYINQMVETSATPTIPTFSLLYNSIGSNSINLSWTIGNGNGRIVVLRPNQPVTFLPTNLSTHGTASTNYSSAGVLAVDHRLILRGTNTTATITNLAPGTTYHVAIYEYNGFSQPVYTSEPLRGFFTTLPTSGLAIGGFDAITFCPSQQVDVPYVFTGVLNAGNVLSVELSDISGSFATPLILGTQSTTNSTGFITSNLPASLTEGVGYRLRVRASNPNELSADNGADLQIVTSVQPTFTVVDGQVSSCGTPITLSTSQLGYNLQWFKDIQPIPGATSSTYQAQETGNYQVRITGASGGCALFSTGTTLTITQEPTFDFQFPSLYCEGEISDLQTQTTPTGGTFTGAGVTGGSFNSANAGIGQHLLQYTYVDAVSSCSYFETRQVQVVGIPVSPAVSGVTVCEGSLAVLTASGAVDGEYRWYDVASGGVAIAGAVNSTLSIPALTNDATYYAVINDGVCESSRVSVTATVIEVPDAPVTTGESVCDNGSLVLTATGGTNGQYRWYTTSSGGTALTGENNDSYTTPALNTSTTYYVSVNTGTCESARTPVVAEIVNTPALPVVVDAAACGTSSLLLSASGGLDGDYRWYENETGGTALAGQTATTFTTPLLTSSTIYYVSLLNGICESVRVPVTATINSIPAQPIIQFSGSADFCDGETLTLNAPMAASYLWSTGATTQSIDVNTAGSFTVSITDANTCTSPLSEPVVTTLRNCNNQPPAIDTTPLSTQVGSVLTFNLLSLLTDPDDNLDLSTLQIISQPESGALASIENGNLQIDYVNVSFTGIDRLIIQVCDEEGSCTQQQLEIEVVGDVEIYNALSPNDDGLNDTFIIQYINSLPETSKNKVTVYNRWGDEVFSVADYDNDQKVFRGLSNSGKELPTGTYFYKIEFNSGRSGKSGYLYLKR
ncbi:hypothetical protein SanaruYs_18710 [Chryseotalea sanaruensis]|uniref:Fibronectin type-III domain-containing protein n=1 Tax=Chryseotalea sanaruensis TaxID=2482724 RepID=A0A401U9Q5_9BACT|nr:gliding motility-associated C-terminal domain-containing protein [Chryseotalea sanaruensis]GCC51643.1 hypothetical protein SanaruYs_18710 [Chryseotalea sanaruensis]